MLFVHYMHMNVWQSGADCITCSMTHYCAVQVDKQMNKAWMELKRENKSLQWGGKMNIWADIQMGKQIGGQMTREMD